MTFEEELANWVMWMKANREAAATNPAYMAELYRNVGGFIRWYEGATV